MKPFQYTRRDFVITMGMAGTSLMLGCGGCESILDQIANRPMRRRVDPSSPESVAAMEIYADAIAQMKALDASDPRSWAKQALIHGNSLSFLKCQHSTWFFLSWHRWYLYCFERICRKLTGEADWGLPYWNWTLETSVPSFYWDEASQLYLAGRDVTSVDVIPAATVGHDVLEDILDEPNFEIFGSYEVGGKGLLEQGPHDDVHVWVGGTMAAGNSPLDPIFWTHHCMIDYCWYDWNVNREHDNTNDAAWADQEWNTDFVDEDGDAVNARSGTSVLMPFLSYQYEPSQIGEAALDIVALKRNVRDLKIIKKRLEDGAPVHFDVKKTIPFSAGMDLTIQKGATRQLPISLSEVTALLKEDSAERIFVKIGFADFPQNNDFFVRVFVNNPNGSKDTPITDPTYAGSFAFFGTKGMGHGATHGEKSGHQPLFTVDLSKALIKMQKMNKLIETEPLILNFVVVPLGEKRPMADEVLTFTQLDVIFAQVQVLKGNTRK